MNREQKLKSQAIFAHYGLDSQLRILQEECGDPIPKILKKEEVKE